jgi:hypothetical protein
MNRRGGCSFLFTLLMCLCAPGVGCLASAQGATSLAATAFLTAARPGGLPVDLDASQLSVEVASRPVKILSLRPAKGSRFVFALAVDVSGSESKNAGPIRLAAAQLFRELTKIGGSGYLVLFNQGIAASKAPLTPDAAQVDLKRVQFYGGTAVYDAVDKTCTQILSGANNPGVERRILVLLSDGDDDQSHIRSDKVFEDAEREGISVFSMATKEIRRSGLSFLGGSARFTGGMAFVPRTVAEGLGSLVAAIDDQWELRVDATRSHSHGLEPLSVRTSQLQVRLSAPAKILIP